MTATEAYIKAGYDVTPNVAKVKGCQLVTKDNVKAKIAELRQPQTKAALRKKDDNLRYLAAVITTPLNEIGPDSPLCVEYTEEVIGGGSRGKLKRGNAPSGNETTGETILRRRIKKPDPLRAIELYSKLLGHFEPDRVELDAGPKVLLSIKERAAEVSSALVSRYMSKE